MVLKEEKLLTKLELALQKADAYTKQLQHCRFDYVRRVQEVAPLHSYLDDHPRIVEREKWTKRRLEEALFQHKRMLTIRVYKCP